ncbi:CRAL-TRIO domain containing protein [Nitzschia inconspicua]|uniref:CRAL-TRIO domain containing protein n=1 Tax=Nitzschia inconspicua TaxID=303405 RepID=A0A9K3PT21_9STRA|nr:CRAL-TRIO domain containing protein [Nitzschia inconspicua]
MAPKKRVTATTAAPTVTATSIGRGELEKDHRSLHGFEVFTVKWLSHKNESSITAATAGTSSNDDDDLSSDDDLVIDLTTDNAYHSIEEQRGCRQILKSLTEEEIQSMLDWAMPLRHYRAEKGDILKAIAAIKSTLAWRKEFQIDKIVNAFDKTKQSTARPDEIDFAAILTHETETGKIYARGYDKDGRACMYMRPGNENTMNEDNNMRHLAYQIEKAIACSNKNGHGKICLIIDYEGFTLSKAPPMSTTKKTLDMLQKHYAERMYRAYVCNPPLYFRSFWALIKPFVDPITKQKVCFCSGKKGLHQIVDDMGGPEKAKLHLEKCAGGVADLRAFDNIEYLNLPFNVAFDEK